MSHGRARGDILDRNSVSEIDVHGLFHAGHTKERRYESNDSRDIEKGSFSLTRSRWFEDLADPEYPRQKLGLSGGDGCRSIQRVCPRHGLIPGFNCVGEEDSYRKINPAIVNDCDRQGGQFAFPLQ